MPTSSRQAARYEGAKHTQVKFHFSRWSQAIVSAGVEGVSFNLGEIPNLNASET